MSDTKLTRAAQLTNLELKALHDRYRIAVDPLIEAKTRLLEIDIPTIIVEVHDDGRMEIVGQKRDARIQEKLDWYDEQIKKIAKYYTDVANGDIIED